MQLDCSVLSLRPVKMYRLVGFRCTDYSTATLADCTMYRTLVVCLLQHRHSLMAILILGGTPLVAVAVGRLSRHHDRRTSLTTGSPAARWRKKSCVSAEPQDDLAMVKEPHTAMPLTLLKVIVRTRVAPTQ